MEILRTPEDRFSDLPDFNFIPHYVEALAGYEGLRMHYLDEGDCSGDAPVFLCLHGEPSWSYLYRKMIPSFSAVGRVVAPDHFGFGRSDKPVDDAVYSFGFHRDALIALITRLDLRRITLVCQDWGGLLGLTLPMQMPERFTRLLVMNTALGTGDVELSEGFRQWRSYMANQHDLDIGRLFKRSTPGITDAECAAYDAPHPDSRYKAGVRRFPQLVPDHPEAPGAEISRRARDFWRSEWSGESFMAIGMQDPVLGPEVMQGLRKLIRGCPEALEIPDGGHFVQERGDIIAAAALRAWNL